MSIRAPRIGDRCRLRLRDYHAAGVVVGLDMAGHEWHQYSIVRVEFLDPVEAEDLHDDYDDQGRRGIKMPYRTLYLSAYLNALEGANKK